MSNNNKDDSKDDYEMNEVEIDEEETEEDDDDDDFIDDIDDSQFDGFLDDCAVPISENIIEEEIFNYLRLGMDKRKVNEIANILLDMVDNTTSAKQLAGCIVQFILDCSPSTVEFCQRINVVCVILKLWENNGKIPLTEALNDKLDPEKQLNTIPGRSLTYFIRCLVEENYIDSNDLRINKDPICSLSEKDSNRLQQILYNRYI